MPTVFIRPHAVNNGIDDYQVVVKPNNPPLGLNRFGITKAEAEKHAAKIAAEIGCKVEDET